MSRDKQTRKPRVLRKLGNIEKYQTGVHHAEAYTGTSILCRYVVPRAVLDAAARQSGDAEAEAETAAVVRALETAVAGVVLEQPLMRVGMAGEATSEPAWIELESIDLAHHVQWRFPPEEEAAAALRRRHDLVSSELDIPYADFEKRPGWRVVATWLGQRRVDVIFVWNHAHFDGMSGKMFHESLLRHLNSPPRSAPAILQVGDGRVLAVSTPAERFPPPQDKCIVFPVTPGFAAKEGWRELRPRSLVPRDESATLAHWAPIVALPAGQRPTTRLRVVETPAAELGVLLRRCREHGTTLTGLLHALALASLALQLAGRDGKEELARGFSGLTAINTRPYADHKAKGGDEDTIKWRKKFPWFEPAKTMGNYVSIMSHKFFPQTVADLRQRWEAPPPSAGAAPPLTEPAMEVLWAAAGGVHAKLAQRIKAGPKDDLMGMLRMVASWSEYLKAKAKKPREASWLITNIGVFDGGKQEADGWIIDDAEFFVAADMLNPPIQISTMSLKGRGLKIVVCWQEGAVDKEIPECFVANLDAWLRELGRDEPSLTEGPA